MTIAPSFRYRLVSKVEARRLAAKVAADMYQAHLLYGEPGEQAIEENRAELELFLADGLLARYEFGFMSAARHRVVSWAYRVDEAGSWESDRPGGLKTAAPIDDARPFNFLWPSERFFTLSEPDQARLLCVSSVRRAPRRVPEDGLGSWVTDRCYVAGGIALQRSEFRPLEAPSR